MTETVQSHRLCVRTASSEANNTVKSKILNLDTEAELDPVGNPVTFWVVTSLPLSTVSGIEGVTDAILAGDQSEIVQPGEFDPFKYVVACTYGHLADALDKRWGPGDERPDHQGLRFTKRGLARAAQIFGWITALGTADEALRPFARRAAREICQQFDYLSSYGRGRIDGTTVPKYIVELDDDGTFGSFGILAYTPVGADSILDDDKLYQVRCGLVDFSASKFEETAQTKKISYTVDDYIKGRPSITYQYAFQRPASWNGGLNYQGPMKGQSFTVDIGNSRLWSVNT